MPGAGLSGVPETALWTLRNRAEEALRNSGYADPEAVRLYRTLPEDFDRFGRPRQSHPLRARAFDAALRDFLSKHPHGPVIALGEGLQTTYWRLGAPDVIWLSVDLPEIVEAQERLLPPAPAITRLPMSALDRRWLAAAPPGPAMITAEGLFMYLPQDQVYALIADLAGRFPGGALIYDAIPRLLSLLSLTGQLRLSNRYVMPRMPTSQSSRQRARLSRTIPGLASVREVPVPAGRGLWASPLLKSASRTPLLRDLLPSITLLEFADGN